MRAQATCRVQPAGVVAFRPAAACSSRQLRLAVSRGRGWPRMAVPDWLDRPDRVWLAGSGRRRQQMASCQPVYGIHQASVLYLTNVP
jgi:hypothetical protein